MVTDLAGYRVDLGNLLASAVDSSTWTTAILDQALRLALDELNSQLVYETDFTVASAGYEQDLSTITDIGAVLAVAYPWQEGWDFGGHLATWRVVAPHTIYFSQVEPAVGDTIRVRYCKQHVIEDLDSALATTVPTHHRSLLGLWAAAYACDLRVRQISENPAIPRDAANLLRGVAAEMRQRAEKALSHIPPLGRLRWAMIGLD
jgi:hypothetical protein